MIEIEDTAVNLEVTSFSVGHEKVAERMIIEDFGLKVTLFDSWQE